MSLNDLFLLWCSYFSVRGRACHLLLLLIFIKIEANWGRVVKDVVVLAVGTRNYVDVGARVIDVHNIVYNVCVRLLGHCYRLLIIIYL